MTRSTRIYGKVALLMAGIAALLPSFVKIHAHSIDLSYAKKISNSIEEALGNELSFASRVSVSADGEDYRLTLVK